MTSGPQPDGTTPPPPAPAPTPKRRYVVDDDTRDEVPYARGLEVDPTREEWV